MSLSFSINNNNKSPANLDWLEEGNPEEELKDEKLEPLLANDWVQARLADGALKREKLDMITNAAAEALCKTEFQDFLYLPQNRQHIDKFTDSSWQAIKALKAVWLRNKITAGDFNLDLLEYITHEAAKLLRDTNVQAFLDDVNNWPCIYHIIYFNYEAAEAFKNEWVRNRVADGRLGSYNLIDTTQQAFDALCNPAVQSFLDMPENRRYINQVVGFTWQSVKALKYESAKALKNDPLIEILPFNKIATITEDECDDLCRKY